MRAGAYEGEWNPFKLGAGGFIISRKRDRPQETSAQKNTTIAQDEGCSLLALPDKLYAGSKADARERCQDSSTTSQGNYP